MNEEKKKPKVISEKDAIQEAGVEEASESENVENPTEEQPATAETETLEEEKKKPRVKVVVEPVFGERGAKPTAPIAGERPSLVRELEEQAAQDILPAQSPPGTPLEAEKPLTREEAVEKARQIWEENERKKTERKFFNRLKRAIGLH